MTMGKIACFNCNPVVETCLKDGVQWEFLPKTWEQREIPVPDDLLAELAAWQNSRDGQTLVLGTKHHNSIARKRPSNCLLKQPVRPSETSAHADQRPPLRSCTWQ